MSGLAAWALAGLAALGAAPAPAADLEGAWYVLVHYRDLRSAQPELEQWEDRLFVFEREGDGLRFREYPVVLFDDEGGRFERRGGETERVLGPFEPDAGQRREIERGLRIQGTGVREKRLRPAGSGFSSVRSAFDSARSVGFESIVEVDLAGPAPRIALADSLGSSAAIALEGRTEYRGERIDGAGTIFGRYERDGRRVGSFRMLRSGAPRGLAAPPPPPGEPTRAEVEERLYRSLGRQLAASDALPERFAGGGAAERAALGERVRVVVAGLFEDQGNDPRAHAPSIERLARAIEGLYVDEGRSREEIGRMLEDGRLRP